MSAGPANVGELRHRLVLEAPVETPDGAGGVTRSYATAATLWAKIVPVAAHGAVVADGLAAAVTHTVTIRFRDDITTRHRLRLGMRTLRILALRDADGSGRFLEISAEERVD